MKIPWMKRTLYVGVIMLVLLFASIGQAEEPTATQHTVTLNAAMADAAREAGAVAFTFELAKSVPLPGVMPNLSSLPPQPTMVPESSTLVLVGVGLLWCVLLIFPRGWSPRKKQC